MNAIRPLILAAVLLSALVSQLGATGSPPELMSYQGYLVDANGVPLGTDGSGQPLPANYDVIFRIYTASSGGTLLWAEQQTITVDNGYFSVLLGEGTPADSEPNGNLSEVFTGIGADERFVAVAVRFELGGAFTGILPRLRLMSSPYSFLSSQSRSVVNPDGQALITAAGSDVTVAGTLTTTQPISAPSISGNGAGITGINASNLSSGTINDSRLSGNVVKSNAVNVFSANQYFSAYAWFGGTVDYVNGLALNNTDIRLRGSNDANHGLGWYGSGKLFSGFNVDGPVLYGNLGGVLGTSNGVRALRWDTIGQLRLEGSSPSIYFGSYTRQHLNLWGTQYGIGVQSNTLYFRTGGGFSWHRGGVHTDTFASAGSGGTTLANLDSSGNFTANGQIKSNSIVVGNYYLEARTNSDTWSSSQIVLRQNNGNYGFFRYNAGAGAHKGGGRSVRLGGSGNSYQMGNGSNWATYDGDSNWDFGSDRRLKKDIEDSEQVLDRVLAVRLRSFRYKDQAEDDLSKHRGVIAQELQSIFPDMVSEGSRPEDQETYLMVGYSDFGLLAVGAIQEQVARQDQVNAELRAENAELRAALTELQATVSAIIEAQNSGQ